MYKILLTFCGLSVLGLFLSFYIPLGLMPSKYLPNLSIVYSLKGSSAYAVDKYATSKLEASLSTIQGIQNISSKSSRDGGIINIEFVDEMDMTLARFYVSNIIKQLRSELPDNLTYPEILINKSSFEEINPLLSFSVSGNLSSDELYEISVNSIIPYLNSINGLDRVLIQGGDAKEVLVEYSSDLSATLGIDPTTIQSALINNFFTQSMGNLDNEEQLRPIKVENKSVALKEISLSKVNEKLIKMGHIANTYISEPIPKSYYRVNGKNAITISAIAKNNENLIDISNLLRRKLNDLKKLLPQELQFEILYDSSIYLQKELDKIITRSIYVVIVLFVFVLLISRNFAYLLTVLVSTIVTISIAFIAYYLLSVELQLFSIAGMAISIGLIIDNFILVTDHIHYKKSRRIIFPLMASSLTTVGTLLTIFLLNLQLIIRLVDFALIITVNLLLSLLVSYAFVPRFLELIGKRINNTTEDEIKSVPNWLNSYFNIIFGLLRFKKVLIAFIILLFGVPIFLLPRQISGNNFFGEVYNTTIGSSWYNNNLRPYLDKYLGGSLRLFSIFVFENSNYGTDQRTTLYVTASSDDGGTLEQMNSALISIEDYLNQFQQIENYISTIYSERYSKIEITFKQRYETSSFPFQLKTRLIKNSLDLGGLNWNIYGVGKGFTNVESVSEPVNFAVEISGYDLDMVNTWAGIFKNNLEKSSKVRNVSIEENSLIRPPKSKYYTYETDPTAMGLFKLNNIGLYNTIKYNTLITYPSLYLYQNGKYTAFRIKAEDFLANDYWGISNRPIKIGNNESKLISLGSFDAEIKEENIYKKNQEYTKLIELQYLGAEKFGNLFLKEQIENSNKITPLGIKFKKKENLFFVSNTDEINFLPIIGIVIGIVFFICAVLFESFRQPLIILVIIPISFIGVFLTYYLFGINLDMGGLACFILLSGLTVNSAIIILDEFNYSTNHFPNRDRIRIYCDVFHSKIAPISMMIISSILSFIPFLMDGQKETFWFSLASGTIGGLLFSLIALIVYLPIYLLWYSESNTQFNYR